MNKLTDRQVTNTTQGIWTVDEHGLVRGGDEPVAEVFLKDDSELIALAGNLNQIVSLKELSDKYDLSKLEEFVETASSLINQAASRKMNEALKNFKR